MCSTSKGIRFGDRDVSAALNIRRIAAGPGRPRELSSCPDRPAMPNPGGAGQEWVVLGFEPIAAPTRSSSLEPAAGSRSLLSELLTAMGQTDPDTWQNEQEADSDEPFDDQQVQAMLQAQEAYHLRRYKSRTPTVGKED
ncbi:hypothetical protein V8C86DRAFT_3099987 [Haematococcus lacustris]